MFFFHYHSSQYSAGEANGSRRRAFSLVISVTPRCHTECVITRFSVVELTNIVYSLLSKDNSEIATSVHSMMALRCAVSTPHKRKKRKKHTRRTFLNYSGRNWNEILALYRLRAQDTFVTSFKLVRMWQILWEHVNEAISFFFFLFFFVTFVTFRKCFYPRWTWLGIVVLSIDSALTLKRRQLATHLSGDTRRSPQS